MYSGLSPVERELEKRQYSNNETDIQLNLQSERNLFFNYNMIIVI